MAAHASVSGPEEVSPLSGLGLIEDGQDLNEAMESNSWVAESLAAFGTAMDVQQLVSDPLQTLMSWGISWLFDHMSPLKDWLNELAGNPGEVQSFAATWTSIGESLQSNSADLATSVARDLEGQEGMGIAAYSTLQTDIARHIELAGTCSNAMSTTLGVASTIVQVVHDMVRDAIADIVAAIAAKAVELAISCGTLAPKVIKDVISLALEWAGKLRRYITDLLSSGKRLSKLSGDLSDLFTRLKSALAKIRDGLASSGGKGFKPPEPKPWAEGGHVESRYLNKGGGPDGNGARIDYQFDKDGNPLGAQWWNDHSNVADARPDDAYELANFRRNHKESVSEVTDLDTGHSYRYDAGHIANAHLIPDARSRILDPDYDVEKVFQGKHKDAAPVVDRLRTHMQNNPEMSWADARKSLDPPLNPNENNALNALQRDECSLNLFGMRHDINSNGPTHTGGASYYDEFEKPYVTEISQNIPQGSWVASEMRFDGTTFSRPDTLIARIDCASGNSLQFLKSQVFTNVPTNAATSP